MASVPATLAALYVAVKHKLSVDYFLDKYQTRHRNGVDDEDDEGVLHYATRKAVNHLASTASGILTYRLLINMKPFPWRIPVMVVVAPRVATYHFFEGRNYSNTLGEPKLEAEVMLVGKHNEDNIKVGSAEGFGHVSTERRSIIRRPCQESTWVK